MRRNNIDIMVDILKTVKVDGMCKTSVVYKANLNFKRADHYLEILMEIGLVEKLSDKYKITEEGKEYLQKVNELNSIFKYD